MVKIRIEQLGGLAGIGGSSSALVRTGEFEESELTSDQRRVLQKLFEREQHSSPPGGDQIQFKIQRKDKGLGKAIVVNERDLPQALQAKLKLDFR